MNTYLELFLEKAKVVIEFLKCIVMVMVVFGKLALEGVNRLDKNQRDIVSIGLFLGAFGFIVLKVATLPFESAMVMLLGFAGVMFVMLSAIYLLAVYRHCV